ncbi:MAG: hypothetical protein LIP10_01790 [Clostridiales bacterium]|nr:hypothetical protein [Clostridiales bacterium]
MKNNVKRFLELLETNPALKREADELGRKEKEGVKELIALAADHQIFLAAEDFLPEQTPPMSDDELEAVTGGAYALECLCTLGGMGGQGQCSCVAGGHGASGRYCTCTVGGYGTEE